MNIILETGLKIVNTLKKWAGLQVEYSLQENLSSTPVNHRIWDELVKKHVAENGLVNYIGFKSEVANLKKYTALLSANPPATHWTENERLAYWINAYNAFTVQLVVENYPVTGIKEIGGNLPMINSVWDIKFFKIGDTDFDLNTIEHEIIRKLFNEPRAHFALNCASISCPVLRSEAYTAKDLNKQLEEQAVAFLNDVSRNSITSEKIQLSKIFDWFESDFTKEKTLRKYLENYSTQKLNAAVDIEFLEYNWNLNEQKINDEK